MSSRGQLYLVATPIGNLADITFRAIDILKSVDIIAAEDTRHSQRLLSHYEIKTPTISLHAHNEAARTNKIIQLLQGGKQIALISDAGTPIISDPGFHLVRAVRDAGFSVIPVPGACAAIAALIASGLPSDRFIFEGFLPTKSGALKNHLSQFKEETRTIIFYESVHRIVKTLDIFCDVFGKDRQACIARELTKTYETIQQDQLGELLAWLQNNPQQQKGEFVIVLQGCALQASQDDVQIARILKILLAQLSVKQSVDMATQITGARKKQVYDMALKINL